MKQIVIPIRLPEIHNPKVECPFGAVPRGVVMAIEKVEGIIVSAGASSKTAVREVMTVIMVCPIEEDSDGNIKEPQVVTRSFSIYESGKITNEKNSYYIGSAPSMQNGALLHVFEVTPLLDTAESQ